MRTIEVIMSGLLVLSACCHAEYSIQGGSVESVSDSAGGNYKMHGRIGRVFFNSSQGGAYSLTSSRSACLTALQTPGAPALSIGIANHSILLSWSDPDSAYFVQKASVLSDDSWQSLTLPRNTTNGMTFVRIDGVEGNLFFRLKKQ